MPPRLAQDCACIAAGRIRAINLGAGTALVITGIAIVGAWWP